MLGRSLSVHTRASDDVNDSAVCGTTDPLVGSVYTSMSYTAKPGRPSFDPEFAMVAGSRFVISAAFRNVTVPPGWMFWLDTLEGAAVTLVMPPLGPFTTAPDVVVPVVLRMAAVGFVVLPLVPATE